GAAFSASGGDQSRGLVTLTSVGDVDKQYVFDAVHRVWTGSVLFPVTQNRNLWGSPTDPSTGRNYIVYANNATVSVQDDEVPSAACTRLRWATSRASFSPVR